MRYSTSEQITYWLFKDKIPLTKVLIVCNIFSFLAIVLFHVNALVALLTFSSRSAAAMPWTLVTYPFIAISSPISILFSIYWLWIAGASLERSWGTQRYGLFFFSMCAVFAASLWAGTIVTGMPVQLDGLWLPLAGVTIAFAMMNPEQQILFMFVLPLKLKYLALLDVVLVLIAFGSSNLLMGLFALVGCAYSYWWVRPRRYVSSSRAPKAEVVRIFRRQSIFSKLNPLYWLREYRERKRLRRLLEGPDDRDR